MTHLSVEDPDDGSRLLPEAVRAETATPAFHRQRAAAKRTDTRDSFLSRSGNLAFSLVLLIGCYSAILIPAYLPSNREASLSDDYQQPKDLVLLNRSASLLSGPCRPRWCLEHLKPLACSVGLLDIPVFVQQDRPVPWDLSPPLGLQGSEEHLALALASLPQPGLPPSLRGEESCRRCVVVGSGGVLHWSHLGSHIDQHDIIIRMNNAPVPGFERDAGSRTTIRLMYPEGAPHSPKEYEKTNMVALVVFKSLDLDWLTSVITKQPLSFWSKLWFWREVVDDIPLRPENFRILHPEIIHRTGQALQKYTLKQGNREQVLFHRVSHVTLPCFYSSPEQTNQTVVLDGVLRVFGTAQFCRHLHVPLHACKGNSAMVPTLGASAVVMALQLCDQVSLAGFGYDMQHPETRLHYYETIRMGAMKAQVVHDVSAEKLFLRDLVAAGAVTDLTGAL